MSSSSELVNAGITGSGVKLDWEKPLVLPPGTRTISSASLINAGITGTGVSLGWQGRFQIACRLAWPEGGPTAEWPAAYPTSAAFSVVPAAPAPDGTVRLIAHTDDADAVKRYARELAESAVAAGSRGVRVEVTDAARQPICEIAL